MAKKKIKATAELFLDTKNAKSDAAKFVNDLRQKLADIENAADKMTVFKDLVNYISMADKALGALKEKNSDAFKHMFDGLDTGLREQMEGIFGVSGSQLGQLDVLNEKIGTLSTSSSIKEIRIFAKEINGLFESVGIDVPFTDIDAEFINKVKPEYINKISNALSSFAMVWQDMTLKLSSGFGFGGLGGSEFSGFNTEVQAEIDKMQDEILKLQEFKKDINKTLDNKNSFLEFEDMSLDIEATKENADQLIDRYKILNEESEKLSKGTKEYNLNLAARAKVGLQLYAMRDSGEDIGRSNPGLIDDIVASESFEPMLSEFEKTANTILTNIDNEITEIQAKILDVKKNGISGQTSGHGGEISQYDKLNQKLKEYFDLLNQRKNIKLDAPEHEQLTSEIDQVLESIEKIKTLNKDNMFTLRDVFNDIEDGEITSIDDALNRICNILKVDIPSAAGDSGIDGPLGKIVSDAEYLTDAKAKLQDFFDLTSKIQSDDFYFYNAEGNVEIGKYIERLTEAKKALDVLGDQGLLTAEQLSQVESEFFKSKSTLEAAIVYYDGYGSGYGDYSYAEKFETATKENERLAHDLKLTEEQYQSEKEENERLKQELEEGKRKQNTLNQGQGSITSEDDIEDIRRENGALEEKLELLQEIAEQYASTITQKKRDRFEELNQKDMNDGLSTREEERMSELFDEISEADEALEEFGNTYDKITLKLANGKKIDIFPDDAGLRKFDKFINESWGSNYGGIEIDDIVFMRKQEQSVIQQNNQDLQEQLNLQRQINVEERAQEYDVDDDLVRINQLLEQEKLTYEEILHLVKQYHNLEQKAKDAYNSGNEDLGHKLFGTTTDIAGKLVPLSMMSMGSDSPDKWLSMVGISAEEAAQKLHKLYNRFYGIDDISDELTDTSLFSDELSDKSIVTEISYLDNLSAKVDEVREAVDLKTQAFVNEGEVVGQVINEEVLALQRLSELIELIASNIGLVIDGFNQINTEVVNADANKDGVEDTMEEPIPTSDTTSIDTSYALDNTVLETNRILESILIKLGDGSSFSDLVEPLNAAVTELKNVAHGVVEHQKAQRTDLTDSSARIANNYGQLSSIAGSATAGFGDEYQIENMKALADNVVRVRGAVQDTEGVWKGFVVDIDESNKAVMRSVDEQSAFAKSLNESAQAAKNAGTEVKEAGPQDEFSQPLSAAKSVFNEYRKNLQDVDYLSDEAKDSLDELAISLKGISNASELNVWKSELKAVQKQVAILKNGFEHSNLGVIKSEQTKLDSGFNKLTHEQQKEVKEEYDKATAALEKYKGSVQDGKKVELDAIHSTTKELHEKIEVYLKANKAAEDVQKEAKKNAKFGSTVAINATAKHNSLTNQASSAEFVGSQLISKTLQKYDAAYNNLMAKIDELAGADNKTIEREAANFEQLKNECNKAAKALDKLINDSEKTSAQFVNSEPYFLGEDFDDTEEGRKAALTDFVKQIYDVDVAAENFKDNWNKVVFAVDNGDGTFTKMTATFTAARNQIGALAGDVKRHVGVFESFFNELKGKFKSLSAYLISSISIHEVWQQVRKGIEYVREIDSALTELKKVTDETDASYNKFLQDMSKTAGVIGSTVSELTTMAAEWARLGYSMEEAGRLAESTAILLNVSEFEDATKASEALISTMQAFQYTANESQHVVDILNEVGKILPVDNYIG